MEIKIIAKGAARTLASGSVETYSVKWTGEVPDAIAAEWIARGIAEPVAVTEPTEFTANERIVLKAAAEQILAEAGQMAAQTGAAQAGINPEPGSDAVPATDAAKDAAG